MTGFEVQMLRMGMGEVPGPEVFWMSRWDEWLPLAFQVVLVRGKGVVALINTGPARDLEPMNLGWAAFLGDRARFERGPGEFILDQLASVGVEPADVTDVILTPLQLYSVSNVLAFPNARIHLARRGWVQFHTVHAHPHDSRDTTIPSHVLAGLVGPAWDRLVLADDEHEVAPGLRTWWTGAHHRASLAVEIDTAEGVVVVSDAFSYLENVLQRHPIGICESVEEALVAYERAARADHIIPLYDPKNFERYPDGRIA